MPPEEGSYLVEVCRLRFVLGNVLCDRYVDIVVQYDHQADFRG
jgi:hypothetical protein